jgi:hypothetical protein
MEGQLEEETALTNAEQETGVSMNDAVELAKEKFSLIGKQIEAGRELGGKAMDYLTTVENNRVRMAEILQKAKDSEDGYKLAKDQLRVLEDGLKTNFAQRQQKIDKEFDLIDEALAQGNWDAVVKLFDSGSKMVAASPLAGTTERKDKLIKQRRNITSFDDV